MIGFVTLATFAHMYQCCFLSALHFLDPGCFVQHNYYYYTLNNIYLFTGNDYRLIDSTVQFSGDSYTASVNILIVDDQILEYPETFFIQLSIPVIFRELGILPGENYFSNITILDNDGM